MFKSLKISDYFELKKNKYEILKLTPTKSNRNIKTDKIAELVNKMYRRTDKLFYKENKKLIIEQQYKFSFYIHIEKKSIQFYTIIPAVYANQFKVKFRSTWKNLQIDTVDELPIDVNECTKYQLSYKCDDTLSLKTDLRTNELLNNNLSITTIMEEGEIAGLFYNFIPVSEKSNNYFKSNTYPKAIAKYKSGDNLKKNKNIKDYSILALKNIISITNDLLNAILNVSDNHSLVTYPVEKETSNNTKRKAKKDICQSQILTITKCNEKEREIELSNTLFNTFKIINDDNELISKEITKDIDIKKTIINNVNVYN